MKWGIGDVAGDAPFFEDEVWGRKVGVAERPGNGISGCYPPRQYISPHGELPNPSTERVPDTKQ